MRVRSLPVLVGAVALASACSGGEAALDTDAQIASYAVGLEVGQSLSPAAGHLDIEAFARGVQDVLAGNAPALDAATLDGALQRFSETIQASMNEAVAAEAQANRAAGEAYMQQNAQNPNVQTTASGLQYEVLEEGTGPRPVATDQVTVTYRGTLVDGTEFDAGTTSFPVGGVIPGFAEALQLMTVGSRYRVVIPGDLAYGPTGAGANIGPDETLVFEIELLSIP